jgi:RNA polymerase sigma-70 factor (sigma-E family)
VIGEETSAPFVAVYEAAYPRLVRIATAIIGDRGLAEEIVQDAFAATWRQRVHVGDLDAYVRRATINGCRSHMRRHRVRRERTGFVPEVSVADVYPELVASIARLGFRQRTVIILRYYDGLSDDTIAAALGVRPATVRSTAARALQELREVLTNDD